MWGFLFLEMGKYLFIRMLFDPGCSPSCLNNSSAKPLSIVPVAGNNGDEQQWQYEAVIVFILIYLQHAKQLFGTAI